MLKDQFSLEADITDISGNPDLVIYYPDSCCENTAKLTCTSVIALLKCNGCETSSLGEPVYTYIYLSIPMM